MSYPISSFSTEFFLAEPESERPVSILQAIRAMSDDDWERMCEDCFPGIDPERVDPESVLELVQKTDTCTDLSSPVEVWIDPEGYHSILVYED